MFGSTLSTGGLEGEQCGACPITRDSGWFGADAPSRGRPTGSPLRCSPVGAQGLAPLRCLLRGQRGQWATRVVSSCLWKPVGVRGFGEVRGGQGRCRAGNRTQTKGSKVPRATTTPLGIGAEGRTRTGMGVAPQQFLRLPRLPFRHFGGGAEERSRTADTAIFSRVLYHLSYLGIKRDSKPKPPFVSS